MERRRQMGMRQQRTQNIGIPSSCVRSVLHLLQPRTELLPTPLLPRHLPASVIRIIVPASLMNTTVIMTMMAIIRYPINPHQYDFSRECTFQIHLDTGLEDKEILLRRRMQMIPVLWRGAKIRCRDLQGLFVELCFVFRTIWSFLHFFFFFVTIFCPNIPRRHSFGVYHFIALFFLPPFYYLYAFSLLFSLSLAGVRGGTVVAQFPCISCAWFFWGGGRKRVYMIISK